VAATIYGKEQRRWYFSPHSYDYQSFLQSQDKFVEYGDQYEFINAINPGKFGVEWVRKVVEGGRTAQVVTWEEALEVLRTAKEANDGENLICMNMTCICKRTRGGDVSEPICMFMLHPPKEKDARQAFIERIEKAGESGTRYIYDPIDSDRMRELLLDYERRLGLVHTVFTIGFPHITTLCNCEMPYCHSLRQRFLYDIPEAFVEGYYVASVSNDKCVGCGKCPEQCQFGAIRLDRKLGKVTTMPTLCMGCGICRSVCPTAAIEMRERADVTLLQVAEPVGLLQESET
jgi:ferredoxin